MSLHQVYRSASNPLTSYSPSPPPSMYRKPAPSSSSFRSVSPLPPPSIKQPSPPPISNHVYQPTPLTTLNSFPPQRAASVTIISPISPPQEQQQQQQPPPQAYCPSPASITTPTFDLVASNAVCTLTPQEIDNALKACLRIQEQAVTEHGKRPFAALLLGPDSTSIIATHNSLSHYQHAESELARLVAAQYSQKYLERCTLVSTWEPCAMCSGTIYWTGIGRVLYAASEAKLKELTGSHNDENMTMSLPCRTVFDAGQRKLEVIGPVTSWEAKVVESSEKWWRDHQAGAASLNHTSSLSGLNGATRDNASTHSKRTSITIYNPEDSLLGSIGEDGEYQADLKIDWMP